MASIIASRFPSRYCSRKCSSHGSFTSCTAASPERGHRPLLRQRRSAVSSPFLHKLPSFLEKITTAVCGLDPIGDRMCERHFDDMVGVGCYLCGPIAERRAEAVHGDARTQLSEYVGHRILIEKPASAAAAEHRFCVTRKLTQDRQDTFRERHPVNFAALDALGGNSPNAGRKIELAPTSESR